MPSLDSELVTHALKVARQHGFAEVEIGVGDSVFRAKLDPAPRAAAPARSAAPTDAATEPSLAAIKSPIVGYYQERAEPLLPGQVVKHGDVVAVIAALGLANDVESQVSGEVVDVLVQPGDPVQYGQVLATVRP